MKNSKQGNRIVMFPWLERIIQRDPSYVVEATTDCVELIPGINQSKILMLLCIDCTNLTVNHVVHRRFMFVWMCLD